MKKNTPTFSLLVILLMQFQGMLVKCLSDVLIVPDEAESMLDTGEVSSVDEDVSIMIADGDKHKFSVRDSLMKALNYPEQRVEHLRTILPKLSL